MPNEDFVGLAALEAVDEEELAGFNVEADANAALPPIPAGDYLCILSHQETDEAKLWGEATSKSGVFYRWTNVTAEIAENNMNPRDLWGRKVFPSYRAMTLVMRSTGTTQVQAILQGIGKGQVLLNGPRTSAKQAVALSRELLVKPLSVVTLEWEAQVFDKEQKKQLWRMRGMRRFRKLSEAEGDGYDPNYHHKEFGTVTAQNYVVRFCDPRAYKAKAAPAKQQDSAPMSTVPTTKPQPKSAVMTGPPSQSINAGFQKRSGN